MELSATQLGLSATESLLLSSYLSEAASSFELPLLPSSTFLLNQFHMQDSAQRMQERNGPLAQPSGGKSGELLAACCSNGMVWIVSVIALV